MSSESGPGYNQLLVTFCTSLFRLMCISVIFHLNFGEIKYMPGMQAASVIYFPTAIVTKDIAAAKGRKKCLREGLVDPR